MATTSMLSVARKQLTRFFPSTFEFFVMPGWAVFAIEAFRDPRHIRSIGRIATAARLPFWAPLNGENCPEIEVLVVVARKDFETLEHAIRNVQNGSTNEISKLSLVTPDSDLAGCQQIASRLSHHFKNGISVRGENQFFDGDFLDRLRSRFGTRYGWVLQQLLTVQFVFESIANGVLVLDADTVLTQPRLWLDQSGDQILLVSGEFNAPYYSFLNEIFSTPVKPRHTFVTHHMLMQPALLRSFLESEGIASIEDLGNHAIDLADVSSDSPVCLEFEVYGQLFVKHGPSRMHLVKFGNLGLATDSQRIARVIEHAKVEKKYFSLSFHAYFRIPSS
jgi:hypothetical protein